MKPSHYTTPRSLSECYFDPRGQAIFDETNKPIPMASADIVVLCCSVVALIAAITIIYFF
jgi:hypothetical protein